MRLSLSIILAVFVLSGCKNDNMETDKASSVLCSSSCEAENKTNDLACKLTTAELRERKATVIASLKKQLLQKKELEDGYAFKFAGTDKLLDELTEFIKTERECCDFFTFNISVSGDKTEAWLSLTGKKGSKEFISAELGL